MTTTSKTWFPTKHTWMQRHKSGIYYARLRIAGKDTCRSLKTKTETVAVERLKELRKDVDHLQEVGKAGENPERMTGGEAMALRKAELESDASIKPSTRKYWNEVMAALARTWPEFATTEVRRITVEQCQEWARQNKDAMSPTRFNNSLSALRSILDLAIKKGARRTNPAADLKRMRVRTKDLSEILPTKQEFQNLVRTIRDAGGRFSKACADLVEFLAYTGLRTSEAKWVRWNHCNFDRSEILVVGDPVEATKNGETRRVPMNAACRDLLARIRQERGKELGSDPVMSVHEAQKSLDRAFGQLGMKRFTHHDLRHYFATICIESGVDIPTVAKWLGHKDGGALAMKIYGHLRNEHSLAAATKVSFAA
ncbi:MAG: tyrosine-type recombinase/integrase [Verrucomicrobiales bacterium]